MLDFISLFSLLAVSAIILTWIIDHFKNRHGMIEPPAHSKKWSLPKNKQSIRKGERSLPAKQHPMPGKVLVIPKCGECYLFSNKSGIGVGICKYTPTGIIPFVYHKFRTDDKPYVMHAEDRCCDLKRRQDALIHFGSAKFTSARKIAMTGKYIAMEDPNTDKYTHLLNQVYKEILQRYAEIDRYKTAESIKYKESIRNTIGTAESKIEIMEQNIGQQQRKAS